MYHITNRDVHTRTIMFTEQPTSLLTRLEAWSKGRNSRLLLQTWLKPMTRKIIDSSRGPVISDLLNGHSTLLSTYLCLYLYICVSPNLGQRCSYCSGSWLMWKLKSAENQWLCVLSCRWDIHIRFQFSRRRDYLERGGRKNVRARGWEGELWNAL